REAWKDPKKRKLIEDINLLMQGALRADKMVGLKMNLPKDKLAELNGSLPSLNSPTVAELQDPKWLSVEIMVEEKIVRELIPRLREFGAEGIIEYPLNKVI
ncbi:MAG: ATP phosphoribosyltransferase, partial [Desulfobacterium sp.]|nr:ATP phosphoribosyltransferase [Desulfobacterium sp.]